MELIDTHAHLYEAEFTADLPQVIARNRAHHISKVYLPNIGTSTISPMLALEAEYPDHCAAMMGIHPCEIGPQFQQQLYQAEAWLNKRKFAAIGEVGIDLYHDKTYQNEQQEAFSIQLSWAKQHQLPIVIHSRASFEETFRLLEKHQEGTLTGILHCFSGSPQQAARIIQLGFYLGIGGIVTFANATLAHTVAQLSLDHLVLETDAPYLAPTPHRGQRNEPAYLRRIAEKVAEIHNVPLATVAQKTTENAKKIFGP